MAAVAHAKWRWLLFSTLVGLYAIRIQEYQCRRATKSDFLFQQIIFCVFRQEPGSKATDPERGEDKCMGTLQTRGIKG